MNYTRFTLITLIAFTIFSCSKSESESTPEPDLTSKITGVYTLTKLTNKDAASTVAVTGTGSATLVAIDKSTIDMVTATTIKIGTSSTSTSTIRSEYKVSQSGSDYMITQGGSSAGKVSGNKLTKEITVLGGLVNPNSTYLVGEFAK